MGMTRGGNRENVSVPRIVAFLKNPCAAEKLLKNPLILFDVSAVHAKASGAHDFFTGTKRISTR